MKTKFCRKCCTIGFQHNGRRSAESSYITSVRQTPRLTVAALLLNLLGGCETPLQAYYPPTDVSHVIVTTDPYNGPHQEIKRIYRMVPGIVSNEELAAFLQTEGAQVGADMVVECQLSRDQLMGTSTAYGIAIKISQ
jgi:hypothetical protein